MNEFLQRYLPNFLDYQAEFLLSLQETLIMMVASGVFILLLGLIIGTALVVTREGNILENKWVNKAIDIIVNVFRAIPFVILISLLIPITKSIMGTFIGVKGAIFPLIIGATPFFVRQAFHRKPMSDQYFFPKARPHHCPVRRDRFHLRTYLPAIRYSCRSSDRRYRNHEPNRKRKIRPVRKDQRPSFPRQTFFEEKA